MPNAEDPPPYAPLVRRITDVGDLKPGKNYWLQPIAYCDEQPFLSKCRYTYDQHLYFEHYIWAMPDNDQATPRWNIYGPLPDIVFNPAD